MNTTSTLNLNCAPEKARRIKIQEAFSVNGKLTRPKPAKAKKICLLHSQHQRYLKLQPVPGCPGLNFHPSLGTRPWHNDRLGDFGGRPGRRVGNIVARAKRNWPSSGKPERAHGRDPVLTAVGLHFRARDIRGDTVLPLRTLCFAEAAFKASSGRVSGRRFGWLAALPVFRFTPSPWQAWKSSTPPMAAP